MQQHECRMLWFSRRLLLIRFIFILCLVILREFSTTADSLSRSVISFCLYPLLLFSLGFFLARSFHQKRWNFETIRRHSLHWYELREELFDVIIIWKRRQISTTVNFNRTVSAPLRIENFVKYSPVLITVEEVSSFDIKVRKVRWTLIEWEFRDWEHFYAIL